MWFDPPFNKNVNKNVAKRLLDFIEKYFPKHDILYKIFNSNSVKVSHFCTNNMKSVMTAHNKKISSQKINTVPPCNCRIKNKCPMNIKCKTRNIFYKCVASTCTEPDKVYLETTEGDFKRFYNH